VSRALVFDCDGVLGNTERDGHLVAFNQAFAEAGLDVRWSVEVYTRLLKVPGGKERMRLALFMDPKVVACNGLPTDPEEQTALLAEWHRRKSDIFQELVRDGRIPARPGVARLAAEARTAGWQVAVASTAAQPSVRAMVHHVFPPDLVPEISVFAGDIVAHKKPAPDVFLLTLDELAVAADEACVIEDSEPGLIAAKAAGCPTIIAVSDFTIHENFAGADLVVDSLGDPGAPMTVIDAGGAEPPVAMVTLDTVESVIRRARSR
jgi:beta-phosphoglucomutase-like phosphatase (HAD superfamily)